MDEYIARHSRIETIAVNFIYQVSSGSQLSATPCRDAEDLSAYHQ